LGGVGSDCWRSCVSRSGGPVGVGEGCTGDRERRVDASLPENEMVAAVGASFSAPAVQTRSEEVGRHRPRLAGGGSDKLIDFGKRLRDLFRRKAVAHPLTSNNQVAIQPI